MSKAATFQRASSRLDGWRVRGSEQGGEPCSEIEQIFKGWGIELVKTTTGSFLSESAILEHRRG